MSLLLIFLAGKHLDSLVPPYFHVENMTRAQVPPVKECFTHTPICCRPSPSHTSLTYTPAGEGHMGQGEEKERQKVIKEKKESE